jgi:Flp pilus assembly protein TadG
MFAIFEYGRYLMVRQIVDNAARAGARQAVPIATSFISASSANTTVTDAITQNLAAQNLQNLNVQIFQSDTSGNNIGTWQSTDFGDNIAVQIDADLPILLPTFGFLPNNGAAPNSVHIKSVVMMKFEAN